MQWITDNANWFFSGLGVAAVSGIGFIIRRALSRSNPAGSQSQKVTSGSQALQAGRDINISKK